VNQVLSNSKKIRVVVDARKLGDGGIGTYIENLVDGLLELEGQDRGRLSVSLLVAPDVPPHVGQVLRRWQDRVKVYSEGAPKYSLREYLTVGVFKRSLLRENSLYHSPHYTLPFFLGLPSVVTIHDTIHVTRPESVLHRPFGSLLIRSAVSRASRLIAVSEYGKRKLIELTHVDPVMISVVQNSLHRAIGNCEGADVGRFRAEHGLEAPYFLFVGSDRPHKGFRELVEAYQLLVAGLKKDKLPVLVVVGEGFSNKVRSETEILAQPGVLRFMGRVESDSLGLLYGGASVVVVPSKEEGFGLVALEGMASGAAVVCTPCPSLREVCGDSCFYADDFSPQALARAMQKAMSSELRAEIIEKARRRSGQFSRLAMAERTLSVYGQAVNESKGFGSSLKVDGPRPHADSDLCDRRAGEG